MFGYLYRERFGSKIFDGNASMLEQVNRPNPRRKMMMILDPSHSSYLPAYEDGTDRVFRNVNTVNPK